ncbi:CobW family GTP-binding protein [Paeniglutamicibacter kerguelensis]|uniref:G3E family GTPase n=1 Tax=Paeniglutamicibacter kerguelensis TaxID=254788 RepID=A0ABS4XIW3_9MICC|nr:GTP-binding protein [Paeniglutamicibacter kerguelensis]MBP2388401.1 G3E family GTPase [Paeniglutamicibacter kerguelensis]
MQSAIPVTFITGFLGSGKTTLVNRLLQQKEGLRVGVVVNEFGELPIDGSLISRSEGMDIVELANGCVCCASRGDLEGALSALASSGKPLDHILLESSGLADPGPVIERLVSPPLSDALHLQQTVTLVDAANFDRNLEHAEAAYNQITHADLLVLNKTDLVSPQEVEQIRAGLELLNPSAPVLVAVRASLDLADLLAYPPRMEAAESSPSLRGEHVPHAAHGRSMTSISLTSELTLDEDKFRSWLGGLPPTVIRVKGIVKVFRAGESRDLIVHVVSGLITLEDATEIGVDGQRGVVVIGSDLDDPAIRSGFQGCIGRAEEQVVPA